MMGWIKKTQTSFFYSVLVFFCRLHLQILVLLLGQIGGGGAILLILDWHRGGEGGGGGDGGVGGGHQ